MSKKKPVKANTSVTKPQYFKAIDLLLAAVEYTRKGMPNRAAKALAEAAQDQQIDDAMNQLNDQQQDLQDQNFDQDPQGVDFDQQQQQTSRCHSSNRSYASVIPHLPNARRWNPSVCRNQWLTLINPHSATART